MALPLGADGLGYGMLPCTPCTATLGIDRGKDISEGVVPGKRVAMARVSGPSRAPPTLARVLAPALARDLALGVARGT